MRKKSPSRVLCAVSWCVAFARVEGQYCACHQKFPKLKPEPGVYSAFSACEHCDDGECPECEGEGEHRHYECSHCYGHRCDACRGSGKCRECLGVNSDDEKYLRELAWAYQPPASIIDYPWAAL